MELKGQTFLTKELTRIGGQTRAQKRGTGIRLGFASLPVRTVLDARDVTETSEREVAERRALRVKLRRHEHSYGLGRRPMKEREEEEGEEQMQITEKDGDAAVRCYCEIRE